MNLQNGTLDTRLPQNIVRNFEIPANVEHDKLNPFKIGGGNAIWTTHLPPNVNVWFSTNSNFDNAQKLDYMNRGMRFNAIGADGIQQQYDNFYIFTEGTWDDVIKISVSSQGDMVEPILSNNTGDIENISRVAAITKMPVNGASGYNEPDFEIRCNNKISTLTQINYDDFGYVLCVKCDYDLLNFLPQKNYLFEIDKICFNDNFLGSLDNFANSSAFIAFGFLSTEIKLFDYIPRQNMESNLNLSFAYQQQLEGVTQQDISPNVRLYDIISKNQAIILNAMTVEHDYFANTRGAFIVDNDKNKIIVKGNRIMNKIPVIIIIPSAQMGLSCFFDFNVRIYSL